MFFGCYPAFAAISRSSTADISGGKTQLTGLISAIIVLLSMFFIGGLLHFIPLPAVASIIIFAVMSILRWEEPLFFYNVSWTDISLFLFTCTSSMTFGVDKGVLICVSISLVILIKNGSRVNMSIRNKQKKGNDEESMIVE